MRGATNFKWWHNEVIKDRFKDTCQWWSWHNVGEGGDANKLYLCLVQAP